MSEHVEPKSKTVKIPGPDHPISVERNASRVVVTVAGRIVADTREALTLREASYPPVQYIPRKDVDMTLLARTDHATAQFAGRCALHQRCLDLRISLRGGSGHQGLSRLLSRPRRRDR